MSELVSTNWVYKNLDNRRLVILDCSWHMPQEKRNAKKEYEAMHIKNAYFFDIDKISDIKTNLPHMLPSQSKFQKIPNEATRPYLFLKFKNSFGQNLSKNLKKKLEVLVLIRIH